MGYMTDFLQDTAVGAPKYCEAMNVFVLCRGHTYATAVSPAPVVKGSAVAAPVEESVPTGPPVAGKQLALIGLVCWFCGDMKLATAL